MGRHSRYQWTRLGLQPRSSDSPVHACTRPPELRRPVACRRRHTHRRRPPGCLCVPRNHLNPYSNPDSYTDSYRHSHRHRDTDADRDGDTDSDTETNPGGEAAPYTGASSDTAAVAARIISLITRLRFAVPPLRITIFSEKKIEWYDQRA